MKKLKAIILLISLTGFLFLGIIPVNASTAQDIDIDTEFIEDAINSILGQLLDIVWNEETGGGILPILYSLIPGFGSRGHLTVQVFFIFCFAGGVLYITQKLR
jgi:hypothetical protein